MAATSSGLCRLFGASYWCRNNPQELILDGSAEVHRLESFQQFCSAKNNQVQRVRILTFQWAMHKRRIPDLATALGSLVNLREVQFDNFSHSHGEYEILRSILEATQAVLEKVCVSCDNEAFDTGNEAWCYALRRCKRLRVFRMWCGAGILLDLFFRVPLDNPNLQELSLCSGKTRRTLQRSHILHLTALPALKQLKLEGFLLRDDACQALVEFCQNRPVDDLELPGTRWESTSSSSSSPSAAVASFLAFVARSPLKHLNLRDCQLNDVQVKAIAEILPQTRLKRLVLAENHSITDACIRNLWNQLKQSDCSLRALDLEMTNLSPCTITEMIEEKCTARTKLDKLHVDRQHVNRPWTAQERNRILRALIRHPELVGLGKEWGNSADDSTISSDFWSPVDSLLWLNDVGRNVVLSGRLDPCVFLARINRNVTATFLFFKHDGGSLGLV